MIPCSPKEAKQIGATQYFSSKPCSNGHTSNRYTSSKRCVECTKLHCQKRRQSETFVQSHVNYMKQYNAENRHRVNAARREKLKLDKDYAQKEKVRQQNWYKSEAGQKYCRVKWIKRSVLKRQSLSGLVNIKLTRLFCMQCPKNMEIDHIIPISKEGRHDISNLQYLTKAQNASKKNKPNKEMNWDIECLPCDPFLLSY